jgi:hypothetical protein
VLVPKTESQARHDPDKSVGYAVLAHVSKARSKHGMMDFYSGRASPFGLSCCMPGSAHRAMNNTMTSVITLATTAATLGDVLLPPKPIHT